MNGHEELWRRQPEGRHFGQTASSPLPYPTVMGKAKDPKRVRAGKRSRAKGKTWERAVVRLLKPLWEAFRGHQDSRGGFGGGEGCDVEGTPFYVECRHEQSYNWRKHLHEAMKMREQRGDKRPIVLIAKEDKHPPGWKVGSPGTQPIAIMLLDEWIDLITEVEHARRAREDARADDH